MSFGGGPVLFHECDAAEAHFEICAELFFRQIAFKPPSLFAFAVEDEHGRRPDCVESVEISGVLFYMHPERDEVFVNVRRQTGVAVRLVLEPLTGTSGRCGAEIDEQRFILILSLLQCLVGVFDPVYGHIRPPFFDLYMPIIANRGKRAEKKSSCLAETTEAGRDSSRCFGQLEATSTLIIVVRTVGRVCCRKIIENTQAVSVGIGGCELVKAPGL